MKRSDLILWTDASFFPESRRCGAAFGCETDEGLRITAFRVRGSAFRGEVLAIFAALAFAEQNFADRDVTLFSDCESAIARISSWNSTEGNNCCSTHKHICNLLSRFSERGRKIRFHWVKAHSSIPQNDMIDAAAKKEALNFRREALFEEKPELPGDFSLRGQIVDSRQEIEYDEWRPDLDKNIMRVARSYLARRIFAGVEQWRGLKSNWATHVKTDCIYCKKKHSIPFGIFLKKCARCEEFRGKIERLWSGVTWDDELLEGRVTHKMVQEMMKASGKSRDEITKEARTRIRKWEKEVGALCKELKGRGSAE